MISLGLVKYFLVYKPYIEFIVIQVLNIKYITIKGFLTVDVGCL